MQSSGTPLGIENHCSRVKLNMVDCVRFTQVLRGQCPSTVVGGACKMCLWILRMARYKTLLMIYGDKKGACGFL